VKIIEDLLSILDYGSAVRDVRQGPFQTAAVTRNCGLASTPHDSGPHHTRSPVKEAGSLVDYDSRTLARLALSASTLEAAIGMAAINSLLKVEEQYCTELNAGDLLAKKGEGKKVAIVGHFPFIPRLRTITGELWVIEKNPQEGDFPEAESERLIPPHLQITPSSTCWASVILIPMLSYWEGQLPCRQFYLTTVLMLSRVRE